MGNIQAKAKYVFESSWEVCNKVGGIYTVVKSKAALMKEKHENYFLIGPYFENNAAVDLEKRTPPEYLKKVFDDLKNEGINCYYGVWIMKAEPNVILVDAKSWVGKKNDFKGQMWNDYGIDSLYSGWEFEEPLVWSMAVGRLLEKIAEAVNVDSKKPIVGHFHEWLAGFSLLYLKKQKVPIATVFTTHATMLGRSISGSGLSLYEMLPYINPEEEAKKFGVMDKFSTERACAQNADIFTTVSEITGIEAEKILGRKPEVLVLNGLDLGKFPTIEDTSIKHADNRDLIREFISYYFFPYYTFDMEENLIFYIVGRYEYKNKGLDILTKALGRLNEILKKENTTRTITAIYWIPADARGIRKELLENKTFYRHIRNYVLRHSEEIQKNIVKEVLAQKQVLESNEIFSKEFMQNNKRHMMKFKRDGLPPLTTHYLGDEENDSIVKGFKESGLLNRQEDKVKVILYPVYLNGIDGLIDLPYDDCLVGCHLGIFPSYYEPWGYTPLESAAFGVPAITTDLAGYGRFIKKDPRVNKSGIFVLKRYGIPEEQVLQEFTEVMHNYAKHNHYERAADKIDAKELAELADWKELIYNYINAHNLALEKKGFK